MYFDSCAVFSWFYYLNMYQKWTPGVGHENISCPYRKVISVSKFWKKSSCISKSSCSILRKAAWPFLPDKNGRNEHAGNESHQPNRHKLPKERTASLAAFRTPSSGHLRSSTMWSTLSVAWKHTHKYISPTTCAYTQYTNECVGAGGRQKQSKSDVMMQRPSLTAKHLSAKQEFRWMTTSVLLKLSV